MIILKENNSNSAFDFNDKQSFSYNFISDESVGKVSLKDYYKFEKLLNGSLTYMTADEYIEHCINDIFHSSYESTVTHAVDFDKVSDYAELMLNGEQFPVPYLNYATRQQEGRHRALAFKEAFGDSAKLPVVEIEKTNINNTTLQEIDEYFLTKYNSLSRGIINDSIIETALEVGFDKEDVYDYLGLDYEPEETEIDDIDSDDFDLDDLDAEDIELDDIKLLSDLSGLSEDELMELDFVEFEKLANKYL